MNFQNSGMEDGNDQKDWEEDRKEIEMIGDDV